MEPFVEQSILIERSAQELEDKLDDYVVYDVDGTIHACAALHMYPQKTGEIAAVAVDSMYASLGIGKKLVSNLIEKATAKNLKKLFALTTQTSDWFAQLGFERGSVSNLPEEKRASYNMKRNSLVYIYTVSRHRQERHLRVE
jgi:amino-acid N-acetyltransferase